MLIPSIDLLGGQIVQLVQGEKLRLAFDDFEYWIEKFSRFPLVQLIDLDAAMRQGDNSALVAQIAKRLPVQAGGGIHSIERARQVLDAGAKRVIIGSALFSGSGAVNTEFAAALAAALARSASSPASTPRTARIAVKGWKAQVELTPDEAIPQLESHAAAFLYTHVDGEGMMQGFPIETAARLRKLTQRQLIVAGGIRSQQEVDALDALGADAVVGMAVYTELLASLRPSSCIRQANLLLRFADGAAGLHARGAQQPRNLLQMQLHGVGAQNLGLRKLEAGVPHLGHARFQLRDVFLQMHSRRRNVKAPVVNALGHVMKSGANVHGQPSQRRFQLLRVADPRGCLSRRTPAPPEHRRASGQTATASQAFAPSGPPEGSLRAASSSWLLLRSMASTSSRSAGRFSAGAPRKPRECLEERAQHQKLLRQPIAQPQPRAVGKDQRGDGQRHHDAQKDLHHAVQRKRPMRAASLHQHHDGDGHSGQPRTAAQTQQSANNHRRQHGQNVIPRQRAERA